MDTLDRIQLMLKLENYEDTSRHGYKVPFGITPDDVTGVYIIYCYESGKSYIGASANVRQRLREHYAKLVSGIHANIALQRAYRKYGKHGFIWDVLEVVIDDPEKLLEAEERWIAVYKVDRGYNFRKPLIKDFIKNKVSI